MYIYDDKAKFTISGAGDYWQNSSYTLDAIKKIYLNNSIDIVKEIFLSKQIQIQPSMFYDYQRVGSENLDGYGSYPRFIKQKKNADEIYMTIIQIYSRLYKELPRSEQIYVLDKFTTILTLINIANCSFIHNNCNDSLSIIRYLDALPVDNKTKHELYIQSYQQLNAYSQSSLSDKTIIETNGDYTIDKKDIEKIRLFDEQYIDARNNSKTQLYTNNSELSMDEQRKRFCDVYELGK